MFKVARPHVKQFSFGSKKYCKLTASISNQSGIAAEYYFKGRNFPDKKKKRGKIAMFGVAKNFQKCALCFVEVEYMKRKKNFIKTRYLQMFILVKNR